MAVQVDDIIMAVVASAPSVALEVTRCFWATALVLMRLDASLVTSAEKTWILAHDDALRKHAVIMFGELASNAGASCRRLGVDYGVGHRLKPKCQTARLRRGLGKAKQVQGLVRAIRTAARHKAVRLHTASAHASATYGADTTALQPWVVRSLTRAASKAHGIPRACAASAMAWRMLGIAATKHPAAWSTAQAVGRYAGEWWKTTAGPEAKELEPDLLSASELVQAFTDGVHKRKATRTRLSHLVALASPIEQLLRSLDLCTWSPRNATKR